MNERYAVRNLKFCEKDCLCLFVCPTGATDTENSVIDVDKCILELHVSDEELAKRKAAWTLPKKDIPRGYLRLYAKTASSANKGAVILLD